MINKTLVIVNRLGLHARAASRFVAATSAFSCQIDVTYGDHTIDGKSIMSVMMLAAGQGSELHITFNGIDEQHACESISQLVENGFGEE
ncbi:Phosphocarrier protein HPr [invertebrate metagenome]|uniref:Phosphocarrier protein HPr n=1 Tax=invertebrate metagenome TaxID=1711999 RepID=A0A2H9TC79_9ZZZZ